MSGSIRLSGERRNTAPLGGFSRWKLEASLWAGISVIAWETTPLRSLFAVEIAPLAEWIALGLAGVATITAMQVKRRLRQKLDDKEEETDRSPNPLSLIELLREHGVREFGSMYLYMPMPRRARHEPAWEWVDKLTADRLIKGDAWHIKADHVKETVRESHDHLFADSPTHFDVYRLDWQTLNEMMSDELV